MKIKISVFMLCFALLLPAQCSAAAAITYRTDGRSIGVAGTGSAPAGFVSLVIAPHDLDLAAMSAEEIKQAGSVIYKTVKSDAQGVFRLDISLPATLPNGKYRLSAYGADPLGACVFGYVSGPLPGPFLSGINAVSSPGAMGAGLQGGGAAFGADSRYLAAPYLERIAARMYAKRPAGGYDTPAFMAAYYQAEAVARFLAGALALDHMLVEYSAYTGVDYATLYAGLSPGAKRDLQALLLADFQPAGELAAMFADKRAAAIYRNLPSFEELQRVFLADAAQNGTSLAGYNSLPNQYYKDQVFQQLKSVITNARSVAEAVAFFYGEVTSVAAEAQRSSSQPGGNTGGGAGRGNEVRMPAEGIGEIPAPPAEGLFSDTGGHWARGDVEAMQAAGHINGFPDGTFRPDQFVTRSEFVKLLASVLGLEPRAGQYFSDVTADKWYAGYAAAAYEAGIVQGTDEGMFYGESDVTRQDAAVIVARALGLDGSGGSAFADEDEIDAYAKEGVLALSERGLLNGYDGRIRPRSKLTRGEAAALLRRALQYAKEGE